MEESVNYAEYTVRQKAEGKILKNKIACLALYAALIAAYIGIIVALSTFGTLVVILTLPFVPMTAMVLRHLTWNRFVAFDRKYEVANAKLRISTVRGKKEELVFENLISEFTIIAPMDAEYRDSFENSDNILDCRASIKSPDSYFARLEKDGQSMVVRFEATNKMLKVMKFYNSKGIVVKEVRI